MYKYLLSGLLLACILYSCKKDSNDPINLLTFKPWKMAHVDKNPSINPANTIAHIPVSSCQEDDRYTFKKNGVLQISYGSNQCKTGEPSKETLNYTVDFENKKLVIDGIPYKLLEVSADELKYYPDLPAYSGFNNGAIIYMYEH